MLKFTSNLHIIEYESKSLLCNYHDDIEKKRTYVNHLPNGSNGFDVNFM